MTLTIVNLLSVPFFNCHQSLKYRVNRSLCYPCNIMYGSSVPPMPHSIFVPRLTLYDLPDPWPIHSNCFHPVFLTYPNPASLFAFNFYIFSVCSRWDPWTSNYPFAPLWQVFSFSMYIHPCVPVFNTKLADRKSVV